MTTNALLDVIVRPSASGESGSKRGPDSFIYKGVIRQLMASAYQVSPSNVVGEMAEDSIRYDIVVNAPGMKPDAFRKMLQQILCVALHISARKETRDIDGRIVTAPNGAPPGLVENSLPGASHAGRGEVQMIGVPLARLTNVLGQLLEKPILERPSSPGGTT